MTAIILAAGMGRRLALGKPKCLIELRGRTILQRQLAALRAVGCEHFVIVVGYEHQQVVGHVAGEAGRFTFLLNERFAETNTIYSLYLAREHLAGSCMFANGDVLFDEQLSRRLASAAEPTALAIRQGRCGQEEVKVMVDGGRITHIGKELDPAHCLGEFVGVARFGERVASALAAMLAECVDREGIVGDHFERAVDRLCAQDYVLSPANVTDLPCAEIDFPDDLQNAREHIAPRVQG